MKLYVSCGLLSLALAPQVLASEGSGFDNYLLKSPSIVSPSQLYQVTKTRAEAGLLLLSGSVEFETLAGKQKTDISGTDLRLGVALPVGGELAVVALDLAQTSEEFEIGGVSLESTELDIAPAASFKLTPNLSLGVKANIVSGEEDSLVDETTEDVGYNYYTLGATFQLNQLEASLSYATENKDEEHDYNNSPATINIHGRYRISPEFALGVRYQQEAYSKLSDEDADSTKFYLIGEAYLESLVLEVYFASVSGFEGAKDVDGTEFGAIGQFHLASNLQIGGLLDNETFSGDGTDGTRTRLGVIGTVLF